MFTKQLLAQVPSLMPTSPATGICDFVDQNGNIVQSHLETLTAIIEQYEAEQARVCSAVPQCRTDGGVRAAYKDKIENFGPDHNHLNVRGQATEAALIWPVVVSTLGRDRTDLPVWGDRMSVLTTSIAENVCHVA